jgi:DNA invertase Pin-like site-specific DNA recombinase
VSTAQQARSGLGLEAQKISVRNYVAGRQGTLIGEFTEFESGTKNDRPQLAEALRNCRLYRATLIIAQLDRMSRNAAMIARLIEGGLEFVVADFPELNRFTIHILAAVAEYEAKLISDRIKAALAAARSRGSVVDRHAPKHWQAYLRRATAASHLANAARARTRAKALAPLLIKLRDEGRTLNGIAAELDRLEIERPRKGGHWKGEIVRKVFQCAGERPPPTRSYQKPRSPN